jgi:predicted kinase
MRKKVQEVVIVRGLPSSGKTTYAMKLIESAPNRWTRVSRADLNKSLRFSSTSEIKILNKLRNKLIEDLVSSGKDVIIDDVNLQQAQLNELKRLIVASTKVPIIIHEVPFNTSISECISRSPEKKDNIMKLSENFNRELKEVSMLYEPSVNNKAVIVDIDGTILEQIDNVFAFDDDFVAKPKHTICNLVSSLYKTGHKILFLTARNEAGRDLAHSHIKQCIPSIGDDYELYMRDDSDDRPSGDLKSDIYCTNIRPHYDVVLFIDDLEENIVAFRELGILSLHC